MQLLHLRTLLRYARLFLSLLTCKRIAKLLGLTILLAALPILAGLLTTHLASRHEAVYFAQQAAYAQVDSTYNSFKRWNLSTETLTPPTPWSERVHPLIPEAVQLQSGAWKAQMQLYEDWTAEYSMQEMWVYVGGRARGERGWGDWWREWSFAFGDVVAARRMERGKGAWSSPASLAFVDCDVSAVLCDVWWGVQPVMLAHFRTGSPCHMELDPFRFVCSTPYEQVRTLVSMRFSQDALEYGEWEKIGVIAEEGMGEARKVDLDGDGDWDGDEKEYTRGWMDWLWFSRQAKEVLPESGRSSMTTNFNAIPIFRPRACGNPLSSAVILYGFISPDSSSAIAIEYKNLGEYRLSRDYMTLAEPLPYMAPFC
ncbi:hypothetical protein EJ06DRAFT_551107 [Trichodelitschia bisporula]|uniref:Uncharacterized protein n=1 Tax=Trichodelitschia bisporula TaxID=703511 RepID=A0A6G1HMR1_9PEZI|nr:hypothetical protein EJ06DRAFT_551107 [Trichodelitschia bisporula]